MKMVYGICGDHNEIVCRIVCESKSGRMSDLILLLEMILTRVREEPDSVRYVGSDDSKVGDKW